MFDASGGTDGFVSIEVAPELARDTAGHAGGRPRPARADRAPNLFVKIPATAEGIPAIQAMIAEGRSINITLIFSLARYAEVIEAYLAGLEAFAERRRRPVDACTASRRSSSAGSTPRSTGASTTSAPTRRWRCGARRRSPRPSSPTSCSASGSPAIGGNASPGSGRTVQRPLWASTSTKNPAYPDTLYVDSLIGPDTVNTLPEVTIAAFEDHGTLARTIDTDVDEAAEVMRRLAAVGIDMDDVGLTLEDQGVASFHESFQDVLGALDAKARQLAAAEMDWAGWALFGLLATAILTAVMIAAQLAGLDPPRPAAAARHDRHRRPRPGPGRRVLHPPRDRRRVRARLRRRRSPLLDRATWWLGALFGLVHVGVALTVLVPLLPGVHPRMASDRAGPACTAVLEPPGLLGLNYGVQTPAVAIVAHLVFGVALGLLLRRTDMRHLD